MRINAELAATIIPRKGERLMNKQTKATKQVEVAKQAGEKSPVEAGKVPEQVEEKEAFDRAVKVKAVKEAEEFTRGYAQGHEHGFQAGVRSRIDKGDIRRIAFDDGVRHIVTLAETFLTKELGVASRAALVNSGKIPAWWIATLVTDFTESPLEPKSLENEEK